MAATNENTDRRVVPRWRSFRDALSTGELAAGTVATAPALDGKQFLQEKELAWREHKALPFALDLISAATLLGTTEIAKEAAEFVLGNDAEVSLVGCQIARRLLGILEPNPTAAPTAARNDIIFGLRSLKERRLLQPRNAFVWIDLARLYVVLGQVEPARQALRIALGLAPTERFIVRSAARFYLHVKDPEQALSLLRMNPSTPFDPWLVAAEIAVSSVLQKTPKFTRIAQTMVASDDLLPFHTSELSSALGSLEMFAGQHRQANRLFLASLNDPTDNALAQGVWASKRTGLGEVKAGQLKGTHASEAKAFDAFNRSDWKHVVAFANAWAMDEAFSARPRMLASATASSLLNEPGIGEKIAKEGLTTNPGHPGLINNIAFARILQGRADAALQIIDSVNTDLMTDVDAICLVATIGLANYRIGNPLEGRKFYESAITAATQRGNLALKTLATLYLARERVLNGEAEGFRQFREAHKTAKHFPASNIPAIAERLASEVLDAEIKHAGLRKSPVP